MSSSEKGKTRRHRLPKRSVRESEAAPEEPGRERDRHLLERHHDAKDSEELSGLELQLGIMQQELEHIQRERGVLESQRRVLKQRGPAGALAHHPPREGWREDQLARLQEELEAKVIENCELRTQVEQLKEGQDSWEARAMELGHKLRAMENHKSKMAGSRDAAVEQQQLLSLVRQKYRDSQDELDELRALIEDQTSHLEGYRNKYLAAQQQVEEQRRQMEQMEAEQGRLADQVQMEMHRIKAEFQDKLQEMLPLPDILKGAQAKLQEERQLRAIAERSGAELSHELAVALDKNAEWDKEIASLRAQQQSWADERQRLISQNEALERKCGKLKEDINWLKQGVAQLEEVEAHNEKLYESALAELAQLKGELETSRQSTARQASRMRDTTETMRRSFHSQIAELERELAQTRAAAAAAHKEKEELQQRLQTQLTNITHSFGQAQERINSLQSVVDVLKSNVLNIESLPEA